MGENKNLTWREAVIAAIDRYRTRNQTQIIERQRFITEELANIVNAVGARGNTPAQTLSRELQQLRGELLAFLGRGRYRILDAPIDVTDFPMEINRHAILDTILANKLRFPVIETGDKVALQKQRIGQQALRKLTLINYGSRCALCDIQDGKFLVASHIASWNDWVAVRGGLRNVIALCRFHDAMFDKGYFSLTDDFRLLRNPNTAFRMFDKVFEASSPFVKPNRYIPLPEFLTHHRRRWQFE